MDQSRGFLEIDTTIGRDIRSEDIPVITNTLESWCDACENMLAALHNQIERANSEKSQKIQRREALEQEVEIYLYLEDVGLTKKILGLG